MEWTTLNGNQFQAASQTFNMLTGSSQFINIPLGSSNTKGGYIPLGVAPFDSFGFILDLEAIINQDAMFDVLTTSGSTSGILIANIYQPSTGGDGGSQYILPLFVPAGATVFVRGQTTAATAQNGRAGITFLPRMWNEGETCTTATTYGAMTTGTAAVSIDPGAVANTFGPWVTLTSGTVNPARSMMMCIGDNGNLTITAGTFIFDVGMGDVGQEITIFRGMFYANNNDDFFIPNVFGPIPMYIPSGVRLSARGQSFVTDATDRLFGLALYTFY